MKNGVIQRLIYLHSCASKVAQMHAHDIQVSKANIIILLQCLNISSVKTAKARAWGETLQTGPAEQQEFRTLLLSFFGTRYNQLHSKMHSLFLNDFFGNPDSTLPI